MKELLYIPVVMAILMGTVNELVDQSEQVSQKVTDYSQDMVDAVDCAMAAIPLEVCSPDIYHRDFKTDINDTLNLTQRLELEFQGL